MYLRRFVPAGCALALALALLPCSARATAPPVDPVWTRSFAAPTVYPASTILLPLPDGAVLVRNGSGATALNARGHTLWSMPNVDDALLDGSMLVFWRSNVVFAVRARDAGVLWKRPCHRPPYVVAAGARLVTFCGDLSTVLRARDGSVLATVRPTIRMTPPQFNGARALNADYILVSNHFDGAWMGNDYIVVDAHTGSFLWDKTDSDVIDVTATTISIAPISSMLPWGRTGLLERRRLDSGKIVSTRAYATPFADEIADFRGRLTFSHAAAYVPTYTSIYRFTHGDARPQRVLDAMDAEIVTLGNTAFIAAGSGPAQSGNASLYIDYPASNSSFATRFLGTYSSMLALRPFLGSDLINAVVVPAGDRVAVADGQVIQLYDASGTVDLTARDDCNNALPVATRDVLYALCMPQRMPTMTLAAFRRRPTPAPGESEQPHT
jgi:hypothetical protein